MWTQCELKQEKELVSLLLAPSWNTAPGADVLACISYEQFTGLALEKPMEILEVKESLSESLAESIPIWQDQAKEWISGFYNKLR